MNEWLKQQVGGEVALELSGDRRHFGYLVDYGRDVLVLFEDKKYLYVPTAHVQQLEASSRKPSESGILQGTQRADHSLSFDGIMKRAKGPLIELSLGDRQTVYGYIAAVMNDYAVVDSPVHQTLLVPLFHIKWLSPFENHPLSLSKGGSPAAAPADMFADTFEDQLKRYLGQMSMLDFGLPTNRLGMIQSLVNGMVEFTTPEQKSQLFHSRHVKNCVHPAARI